jgi:hypothetical protein
VTFDGPQTAEHCDGAEPLFFLLNAPSIATTAENDQHEPQAPWFFTGGTTPKSTQFHAAGGSPALTGAALLGTIGPARGVVLTRGRSSFARYCSLVRSPKLFIFRVKVSAPAIALALCAAMNAELSRQTPMAAASCAGLMYFLPCVSFQASNSGCGTAEFNASIEASKIIVGMAGEMRVMCKVALESGEIDQVIKTRIPTKEKTELI